MKYSVVIPERYLRKVPKEKKCLVAPASSGCMEWLWRASDGQGKKLQKAGAIFVWHRAKSESEFCCPGTDRRRIHFGQWRD